MGVAVEKPGCTHLYSAISRISASRRAGRDVAALLVDVVDDQEDAQRDQEIVDVASDERQLMLGVDGLEADPRPDADPSNERMSTGRRSRRRRSARRRRRQYIKESRPADSTVYDF